MLTSAYTTNSVAMKTNPQSSATHTKYGSTMHWLSKHLSNSILNKAVKKKINQLAILK